MRGDLNGRTRHYLRSYGVFWRFFLAVIKPNRGSFLSHIKMFNYVMMRCRVKQQENEQLSVQKAFHKQPSRVHNSCKKSPEGILLQCTYVRACVHACAMGRKRGGGGVCENNIRLFRQNELSYCIQPWNNPSRHFKPSALSIRPLIYQISPCTKRSVSDTKAE